MRLFAPFASLLAVLVLAFPASAQDPAAERIKAEIKKQIPEISIDSVRKVPYGGLYEVLVGSEIFYTDEKASFLLMGALVDLKTRENVTDLRMRQVNRIDFASLPLEHAVKIVRGDGSRKVAMFADPNCGYCKRFERDLIGIDNITVYLFLYPILAPDSVQKSKAVWCAPDRGKAWLDYMVRDMSVPVDTSCATPIEKILAWGKSKRIQGTPTIFFEDGERVPGAMAIADFEKKLAAAKPAAKVSAK
jgi:thiol:disulfide interchange protein DsbC